MTLAPPAFDHGSYSTRTCRCGSPMQRTARAGAARQAWSCHVCGRTARG